MRTRTALLTSGLCFILLLLTWPLSAQLPRVSISVDDGSIRSVLTRIEEMTDYSFFYNSRDVDTDKTVSIRVEDEPLSHILATLLPDLKYKVVDRIIILEKKEAPDNQQNSMTEGSLSAPPKGTVVSGDISTPDATPLAGASVLVRTPDGKVFGTMADQAGRFRLELPAKPALDQEIIFSFLGFKDKSVRMEGRSEFHVIMEEDLHLLTESVVVGYGTMEKRDLTGAIANLGGETILQRNTNQVTAALQGALPGITVTRTNSAPGAQGTIRIRGITSMQESAPLVIIDGAPGSMDDVNPSDVEDISVLKDASSAAIYGSRAAAGVILVTTKRARYEEKTSVNYSYSLSVDLPTEMPQYEDAAGYMAAQNEQLYNDNTAVGLYSAYSKETIENYAALHSQNPDAYPDTDWLGMILKTHALRHRHHLGISAGGKNLKTNISLGYDDVDGLFKRNLSWKRFTVRTNNDIKISKWLTATLDVNLKKTAAVNPYYSPSNTMRYMPPTFAAEWSDGRIASGKEGINPYGKMMEGGTKKSDRFSAGGKASLVVSPLKGLKITVAFIPEYHANIGKEFNIAVAYTPWNNPTAYASFLQGAETTDLKEKRANSYSHTTQLFANYQTELGKSKSHHLSAMAGFESYYYNYQDIYAGRGQFDFTNYPYLSMGSTEYMTSGVDNSPYENAYKSFFGRVNYNYKYRYYLQTNFRADGSARFRKGKRWGFFPSVSAGWVLSEEPFMQGAKIILSYLKFRASYGQLGNDRIGNYPYQSTMQSNSVLGYIGTSTTVSALQGFLSSQMVLEDLTWETTESYDIGLDFNLFQDRLRFTGDIYRKITRDMLIKVDIPTYTGYEAPDNNAGDMYTRGWEVSLSWNDTAGDLSYGASVHLSDYKSMMGFIGNNQKLSGGKIIQSHTEYQAWYGYRSDGLFQTSADLASSPKLNNSQPGDIKYLDIGGKDGTPDGAISPTYDRTVLGGSLPRLNYGGQVSVGWKGLDFSLTFQGVGKRKALLEAESVQPLRTGWYNVPSFVAQDHWSRSNTVEKNKSVKYPRYSQVSGTSDMNYAVSDFWLINGAYFRIKDITLGYTFPAWTRRIGIRNLRLSASLSDFLTLDNFPKGWDPEVSSTGYPITKSIVLSASVKF